MKTERGEECDSFRFKRQERGGRETDTCLVEHTSEGRQTDRERGRESFDQQTNEG